VRAHVLASFKVQILGSSSSKKYTSVKNGTFAQELLRILIVYMYNHNKIILKRTILYDNTFFTGEPW
jgi:hypothetical protein